MSEVCFKDSGIEWIGEIPEHWGIKKLKFLGKFFGGLTGKVAEDFSKEEQKGYSPFIPFVNICNNIVVDNNKMEYVKTDDNDQQNLVLNQDILFMMTSENREDLGKSAIYLGEQTPFLNSFCKGFRATDLEIKPKFLVWLLQGNRYREYFGLMGNGFTRINLRLYPLQNLNIALPPLQEQEAIARYLDEKTQAIDELISTHQKSIEKLKNYRTSLISEAVTQGLDKNVKLKDSGIEWIGKIPKHWGTIKIGLAFEKIGSGTTPQSDNETYYDGDIPWVNSGDLNDSVLIETAKKATLKALNDYSALKIYPRHTLVIAMYGATIGKTSLLGIEACVNQACCTLNCSSFFEQKFVFYWFLGNRQNIVNLGIGGGQQNISQDIIKKIKTPLPPLQEQEAIAHYLDEKTQAIDELISTHQKSIEKLKNYRTSLISEAVTGKKNLQGIDNGN